MTISTREAIKIARDTAKEAGYDAAVTDSSYDDDEDYYEIELEDDGTLISITVDGKSGDVLDFTAEQEEE